MDTHLIIATLNDGKVREFRSLLGIPGVSLVSAMDVGIQAFPEEHGETFAENALAKAIFVVHSTGQPAIADDSGLVVDALDGAPGVHSARFGQPGLDDTERAALLLDRMRGVPPEKRTARFMAAVALATPEGARHQTTGMLEGRIAPCPRGHDGFGYDPVFVPEGEERTLAQMTAGEKNRISHRARAIAAMHPHLLALITERWEQ